MALKYAGLKIELREVDLKAFPPQLLKISTSNTVPVLQLSDGSIIDESWDIVKQRLLIQK
jgi:glutathione S-transferase